MSLLYLAIALVALLSMIIRAGHQSDCLHHMYLIQRTLDCILTFYKSGFYSIQELNALCSVHPLYDHFYKSIYCSIDIDFTSLFDIDPS